MKRMRGGGDNQVLAQYGALGDQMANDLKSSGQVDYVDDSILYNATVINTRDDPIGGAGRPAQYRDQRDKAIINHPEGYEMSILRLTVDTTTLPIFQPRAVIGQCDPDLLDYKVGYRMDYTGRPAPEMGLMTVPNLTPVPITSSNSSLTFIDMSGFRYSNVMPFPPAGEYSISMFLAIWNFIIAPNQLEVRLVDPFYAVSGGNAAIVRPQFVLVNNSPYDFFIDFSGDGAKYDKPAGLFLPAPNPATIGALATANFLGAPTRAFTVSSVYGATNYMTFPNAFKVGPDVSFSLACFKSLYWVPEDDLASYPGPPLKKQDYGVSSSSNYYNAYTMDHVLEKIVNPAIENVLYTDSDFTHADAYFGGQIRGVIPFAFGGAWSSTGSYSSPTLVKYSYIAVSQAPFSIITNTISSGTTLYIPATSINASNPPPVPGMIVTGPTALSSYTTVVSIASTPTNGYYAITLSQATVSGGSTATFLNPTVGYFYTPGTSSTLPPIINSSQTSAGTLTVGWYDANVPMSGFCLQRQLLACSQTQQIPNVDNVQNSSIYEWNSTTAAAGAFVPLFPTIYRGQAYVAKTVIINSSVSPDLDSNSWFHVGPNAFSNWDVQKTYQCVYADQANNSFPITTVTYLGVAYNLTQATSVAGQAPGTTVLEWSSVQSPATDSGSAYIAGCYYRKNAVPVVTYANLAIGPNPDAGWTTALLPSHQLGASYHDVSQPSGQFSFSMVTNPLTFPYRLRMICNGNPHGNQFIFRADSLAGAVGGGSFGGNFGLELPLTFTVTDSGTIYEINAGDLVEYEYVSATTYAVYINGTLKEDGPYDKGASFDPSVNTWDGIYIYNGATPDPVPFLIGLATVTPGQTGSTTLSLKTNQTTPPTIDINTAPATYDGNFELVQVKPLAYSDTTAHSQFYITSSASYFTYNTASNLFSMHSDTYSSSGRFRDADKVSAAVNTKQLFNGSIDALAQFSVDGYSVNYQTWPSLPKDPTDDSLKRTLGNIVYVPWNGKNAFTSSDEQLTFLSDTNFKSLIDNFPCVAVTPEVYSTIFNSPSYTGTLTVPPVAYEWVSDFPSEQIVSSVSSIASFPDRSITVSTVPQNYSDVGLRIFSTESSFYVYEQGYPSTATSWCPVTAIAVTTESIPVISEMEGNPLDLSKSAGGFVIADSSAQRKPIITDFAVAQTSCFGYRGLIYYSPSGEYRFSSLSNRQMTQIDFSVFWRHRITGDLIPVLLNGNGGYASIKFLFRPKKSVGAMGGGK